jgi:hypothetical protein
MELQGKDVDLWISTVLTPGSEVWKKMICLETLTVNWSRSTNKRQSRCGTKVGLGALEVTVSGTSVADDAPSGTEISLKDAEGFMNGGVAVAVKVAHATTSKYFLTATGYMTTHDENFPSDDVVDFSFQFDLTGAIDLTP